MLDAHGIVILDRYFWSTAAYQGARGADVGGILAHHATFAPEPDLWLVVDLEVEEGLRRIRARGDEPNAFEDPSALGRARQIFLDLAMPCAHAMKIDSAGHFRAAFRQTLEAFQAAAVRKIQAGGGPVLDRLVDFYGEIQAVPEALRTSCDPTLPPAR
jgi:dTMP kinase